IAVGELKDSLFGIVLVLNTLIGVVQELRAKRTLDRLALLNAPLARVRRDGDEADVPVSELVLDDLVVLRPGDQVSVDGQVLAANGLEVDESLLTGESDPVAKQPGEELFSGSFVAAGDGIMRATRVGSETGAAKLSAEARTFSLVHSELREGINRIITWIGWLMIPAAILLVTAQVRADLSFQKAVQASVAGLVAMVPEGLVLLTSVAFALGAARLARRRVLTKELAAIEGLARVDVICLDKTGTLTQGRLAVAQVDPVAGRDAGDVAQVLAALARADEHPNPSLAAIGAAHPDDPGWQATGSVPFSSARKWSAADFADHGAWVLGAPDVLLATITDRAEGVAAEVATYAAEGRRVLLVASAPHGLTGTDLPAGLEPAALVVLDEQLRPSSPATISYFASQGVTVKVISGDSPTTVGAVARACGVPGAEQPVDARGLGDEPDDLAGSIEEHSVFGRVTPQQKRSMVRALQANGHVVAMTGDGVNDTLALKEADIGVSMGTGSAAARGVARFVLLDNDFAVFPDVVAEGRRVIANIERVANLFLTKTTYAVLLAVAIGIAGLPYPFIPRYYTLLNALTIGIPAFFLALAHNSRRAAPHFLERVLRFAIPAGLITGLASITCYLVVRGHGISLAEERTATLITTFLVAWWVLCILARPLDGWRLVLVVLMGVGLVVTLFVPVARSYFELPLPPSGAVIAGLVIGAVACAVLEIAWRTNRLTPITPITPPG
ncbi:MAG TPA: HAD-IC family P-type ATPase, partial [Acidimicrobiales bacterium]|nr:HAD-IC family P-type ATPase [Acidimicrobiales bacterium]